MLKTGDAFAHYEIETLLGEGGMGQVYRAFDTKLHRRVALKLLLVPETIDAAQQKDATARMIREARAAAALDHPNKVGVHELGEVDGVPYIAMEYIAGVTLRAFVGDASAPLAQKLGWLSDVAKALDAAHVAGLVHRDIKPENVMVREDGIVKVLDFGIARRMEQAADPSAPTAAPGIAALTGAGVVIGTAAYMPPEQMQGHDLDGRADQFAWGVMAFELVAGEHPWGKAGDALAMVGAMLTRPARRVSELVPDVPAKVDEVVSRTLSAKREDRFARMSEVVAELAPLAITAPTPTQNVMAASARGVTTNAAVVSAPTERADSAAIAAIARRSKRGPKWWLGVALVVAGVAGIGVLGRVAYRRAIAPRVQYCQGLIEGREGPRCAGPISEDFAKHRGDNMRLTEQGGHVVRVDHVNAVGRLLDEGGFARADYTYGADGLATFATFHNHHGRLLYRLNYSDGGKRVDVVDADGTSPRPLPDTEVTRMARELDAKGRVVHVAFQGLTSRPRMMADAYGRQYEYGAGDQITRTVYLGADGKPRARARDGAAEMTDYDPRGFRVAERLFDVEGKPLAGSNCHAMRMEVDMWGRESSWAFFDASGQPCAEPQGGNYGVKLRWNDRGERTEEAFFDRAGKPKDFRNESYALVSLKRDDLGRVTLRENRAAHGNLVLTRAGSAGFGLVWDDRDDLREIHELDAEGRPFIGPWGYATRRDDFDERGNLIQQTHLDETGHPAPSLNGAAINRFTLDARDLMTDHRRFDVDGHPTGGDDGVAHARKKFDGLRNLVETAFFGVDDRPVFGSNDIALAKWRQDEHNDEVEKACFDTDGAPAGCPAHIRRRKRDERGLVIEQATFDANGSLTIGKDGYAVVRSQYDRNDDVIEVSTFGRHDEPVTPKGYAKKRMKYDALRRLVETSLVDRSGSIAAGEEGWAIERKTYDARGHVVREEWLDPGGKLVATRAGKAAFARRYDDRNNVLEETSLGVDDKPVGTAEGFATKKTTYDERDLPIEETLFLASGAPVAGTDGWAVRRLRHDDLGNRVEETFLDADRKPVVSKSAAVASTRWKYDSRRRVVETAYLDASGVPMKGPEGAEIVRYKRDPYGRAAEAAYFDAAASPAFSKERKQVIRSRFDAAGRLIEELFVDAAGTSRLATDGCAGHRTKYDERGRKIEETCLDERGRLALSTAGWASRRTLHDARGNGVDVATYAADGRLRASTDGVARTKVKFDDRSQELERAFFDADDKPTRDKRGMHRTTYDRDEAGKVTQEHVFDEKGRAVTRVAHGQSP